MAISFDDTQNNEDTEQSFSFFSYFFSFISPAAIFLNKKKWS